MHERRTSRWDLVSLIGFGTILKLLWLGRTELAHDEPFTVFLAHFGWADLFAELRNENNPPLHFILTKLWSGLVPLDAAWLRVPSALASTLVVWPLFLLARACGGLRVALVAGLMFTLSNYHYGYAHEVRAYALFSLLATLCAWQLWRAAEMGRRATLWLALASVAMVYTHFFGWIMLGLLLVIAMVVPEFREARKAVAVALGAALVSYLPYFGTFISRFTGSVTTGTWLTPPEPEELYNMIWRWSNAPVVAVAALLIIVIAIVRTRSRNTGLRIGLLWTFIPLAGMFLISYRVPMFLDRYLVFAAPGFCLLVAVSLAHVLREGPWQWVPAGLVVGGMAFTFTPWNSGELHPSKVVAQVEAWKGEQGIVLLAPHFYATTFAWHLDKQLFLEPKQLGAGLGERGVFTVGPGGVLPELPDPIGTVVLVDAWSSLTDPDGRAREQLQRSHPIIEEVEADKKVWVYRYRR